MNALKHRHCVMHAHASGHFQHVGDLLSNHPDPNPSHNMFPNGKMQCRFLSSAGAGGNRARPMRLPDDSQYWIKIVHPWVQKFYPVLGLGSGESLLWRFQTPVLYWITFSLRENALPNHSVNRGPKLNTNFFFSNFSGTPGISQQNPGISRQKSLISLVSRGIPNFLAPIRSCGRPPPPPANIRTQKFGFGFLFRA